MARRSSPTAPGRGIVSEPRPGSSRAGAAATSAPIVAATRGRGIRSTLTAKSQTTLPRGVRDALHVGPGDELEYEIRGNEAIVRRAQPTDPQADDPVLLGFLDFLERDLVEHPQHARPLPAALLKRMRAVAAAAGRVGRDDVIHGAVAL